MKSKRWMWIVVFVLGLLVVLGLMTGWNLSFVHDYQTLLRNSEKFRLDTSQFSPFLSILLGILTALAVLSVMIVFFIRLLREMQLNQLQEEFIASVTHEIRTPIAAMELTSSLLREEFARRDLTPQEIDKLWNSHDEELRRLKREVEVLLTASRFSEHRDLNDLPRSAVNLEEWLERALERWRKLLPMDAEISREGEKLEITALLNPRALDLIIDNLLDNVRKYALTTPKLTIRTVNQEGTWSIQFKDQGMGFSPRESEKIFKRFHRARVEDELPAKKRIAGVGLGLYIAKSAAKQMGLDLSAWSPGVGKGCTFTLCSTLKTKGAK